MPIFLVPFAPQLLMKKLHNFLVENYFADPKNIPSFIQKGVDNDSYSFITTSGEKKVARISRNKKLEELLWEFELMSELRKNNARTVNIFFPANKKNCLLFNSNPITCFDFIEHIPTVNNTKLVYEAGVTLYEFHQVSKQIKLNIQNNRTIFTEYKRVLANQDIIAEKYVNGDYFIKNVKKVFDIAEKQKIDCGIIHNDYNTANVLFNKDKIPTIIDFDLSCYGPLIMDVAYGAVCWSTKNGDYLPDVDMFKQFVEGYNKFAPHKINIDGLFFFWAAFSCLSIACDLFCDSLVSNTYDIKNVSQSWMYQRFEYYIDKSVFVSHFVAIS